MLAERTNKGLLSFLIIFRDERVEPGERHTNRLIRRRLFKGCNKKNGVAIKLSESIRGPLEKSNDLAAAYQRSGLRTDSERVSKLLANSLQKCNSELIIINY